MKYSKGKTTPRKCRETRALLGSRFKILLADTGLSPEAAGKLLHVTPRTIRYWLSGQVAVPYAAYRLLRVMRLFELPCEGWDGWHMHSGRLWSPEGHGFTPHDSNWWGLLVRRAASFGKLYAMQAAFNQAAVSLERVASLSGRDPLAGGGRTAKLDLGPRENLESSPLVITGRTYGDAKTPLELAA